MEIVAIAGALGAMHHLFTNGESDTKSGNVGQSVKATNNTTIIPRQGPSAAPKPDVMSAAPVGAGQGVRPIPMMPDRNRDSTLLDDNRTLMGKLGYTYDPELYKGKSSRPQPAPMFGPEAGAVPNVHVTNNTSYRGRETQAFKSSDNMNNVRPITQLRVGPGINVPADKAAGEQGFHYGMTRMMPQDVYVHNQLKGGVIPGRSLVDNRTTDPVMRKQNPDTYFEVSDNYITGAPGKAVVTAQESRVYPEPRYTNRATEQVAGTGPGSFQTGGRDRTSVDNAIFTGYRGNEDTSGFIGVQAAGGAMAPGYQLTQNTTTMYANQRTTSQFGDNSMLPVDNPGQSTFNATEFQQDDARATMRGADQEPGVTNVALQGPNAQQRFTDYDNTMKTTERNLMNYSDVGPAQSYLPNDGINTEREAFESGRLGHATIKETTLTAYQGGAGSALSNPMSYGDVLNSEGYSLKTIQKSDLDVVGRIAGGERANVLNNKNDWTRVELPETQLNSSRDGNLDRASVSNLYVQTNKDDSNPNRDLPNISRVDPSTIPENNLVPSINTTYRRAS